MLVNHFEFECQVDEFSEFIRDLLHVHWYQISKINDDLENDNNHFHIIRNDDRGVTIVHTWDESSEAGEPILEINVEKNSSGNMIVVIELGDDEAQFRWSRKIIGILSSMM